MRAAAMAGLVVAWVHLLGACATPSPGADPRARATAVRDVAAEISAAEQAFARAIRHSDSTTLATMLGAEFALVSLHADWPKTPRAAWYDNVASGRVTTDTVWIRDIAVTAVSADSAVATLWFSWRPILSGLAMPLDITRVEDTWARRDGIWRVTQRRILARTPPS